jgi:hypothetical protein
MKIGNDLRTEGLHMTGPADPTDLRAHFLAGRAEAERLQPRAMMIGYNVGVTTGGELGQVPTTTFQVWRIDDLEHENERTFETPQDVEEHLDYLESLPLFALDLAGDPEVRELTDERGALTVTVTDDQGTPVNVAMMRIQDIEASQRLFIRAEQEDRPTVGSWREVE